MFWLLLAAGLAVACKKQEPDWGANSALNDPGAAPSSPRGPRSPVSEATNNPTVIADGGDVNVTLQQLTQELRDYVVRTRSVPRNFEEFTAKSLVRFPPPPPGKKYAIRGQAVVLVKL